MFEVGLVHSCEVELDLAKAELDDSSNWHHTLLVQSVDSKGNDIVDGEDMQALESTDWQ